MESIVCDGKGNTGRGVVLQGRRVRDRGIGRGKAGRGGGSRAMLFLYQYLGNIFTVCAVSRRLVDFCILIILTVISWDAKLEKANIIGNIRTKMLS